MLTRRPGIVVVAMLAAGAILITAASSATAAMTAAIPGGGSVTCPPDDPVCTITADQPVSGAVTTGGNTVAPASDPACRVPADLPGGGEPVSCYSPEFGWWNNSDGCWYQLLEPQPPASDPVWEGHYPNGAIYSQVCFWVRGTGGGWPWLATPPPGFGGGTNPADLAQEAVRQMLLEGPAIGMAPTAGATGLVGVPVWMWTAVTPSTWGPTSKTAAVPGLSVTATAQAVRIVWEMGDGHSVTCPNPGTAYTESLGATVSPTCGYRYSMSSAGQPDAKYTVTGTTTWNVTWAGGGQTGALTVTRSSTTQVSIGEMQVLVS